jgi:histidyl-tRNA synthetase
VAPKDDKEIRPKARVPRGFRDRRGAEIAAEREMLARISSVYERWGFEPLETPAFEYSDALGKFLPDDDRPNQGVFSLQDDDEQWMSLRYDLTAPLARFVAENYDALPKPFRRYQIGSVWRNEKPGPGRYREFTQCDADTVGAPTPYADAEICMMFGEAVGAAVEAAVDLPFTGGSVSPPKYLIRVSNRKVVDGLFEKLRLAGDESAETRARVMRSMDKFDRLQESGVRHLLGPGRKDDSGDFTEGAKLADGQIDTVIAFLNSSAGVGSEQPTLSLDRMQQIVGGTRAGDTGLEELNGIRQSIPDFESRSIVFDCAVIRGLEYYTGPVFEAEFLSTALGGVSLGSIGGGGRYDGLVRRFKGIEVPAVGVSIGVSRLVAAFEFATDAMRNLQGPVIVLALEADQMAAYQTMAAELRAAGLRAEVYVGGSGMKAQMKYADKRGAPVAVICGGDERAKGEVTIKDLVLGAELSKKIEGNVEWREAQPAQISVSRANLVAAVKETLARRR